MLSLLSSDECSWLSAPVSGVPAEKFLIVNCLVRAVGVDIRERGRESGGGSRKADVVVKLREFFDIRQN